MRKFYMLSVSAVLVFALCACSRTEPIPTSIPSVIPTTVPQSTTAKPMDPTAGTNIPDPSVDTRMTDPEETYEIIK